MLQASRLSQKTELLISYLQEKGVRIPGGFSRYVKVSCFGPAHARGDRNPSATVDRVNGRYKCFSCDLSGDVFDLLKIEKGLNYKQAQATLGATTTTEREETWL